MKFIHLTSVFSRIIIYLLETSGYEYSPSHYGHAGDAIILASTSIFAFSTGPYLSVK